MLGGSAAGRALVIAAWLGRILIGVGRLGYSINRTWRPATCWFISAQTRRRISKAARRLALSIQHRSHSRLNSNHPHLSSCHPLGGHSPLLRGLGSNAANNS